MKNSKGHWAAIDRRRGESAESWARRNRAHHAGAWQNDKVARGEWLSAEDFARLTGRPGKVLSPTNESIAGLLRGAKAAAPAVEKVVAAPPRKRAERTTKRTNVASGALQDGAFGAVFAGVEAIFRGDSAAEVAKKAARSGAAGVARSAATSVVHEGILRVVAKGSGTAARQVARAGTRQAVSRTAQSAAKSVLRGNVVAATAGLVVEQAVDTFRWATGDIDGNEYGKRSVENAGGAAGGFGGAALGAALGSAIFPGVGTVVGGFLGGLFGGWGGSAAAGATVR